MRQYGLGVVRGVTSTCGWEQRGADCRREHDSGGSWFMQGREDTGIIENCCSSQDGLCFKGSLLANSGLMGRA
jgi:hypothetical protein